MADFDPEFHGDDLAAAISRAKRIGGYVIKSTAPTDGSKNDGCNMGTGYWSDPDGFLRSWEIQVYPKRGVGRHGR